MMMLEYKAKRGGVKNLGKSDFIISECPLTMSFVNFKTIFIFSA